MVGLSIAAMATAIGWLADRGLRGYYHFSYSY
jgi:hypothetical protein